MLKPVCGSAILAFYLLVAGCSTPAVSDSGVSGGSPQRLENRSEGQFREGDTVSEEAVLAADLGNGHVAYAAIETPWGTARPSLWLSADQGLILRLWYVRSLTRWSDADPKPGDVTGVIVRDGQIVQETTNRNPVIDVLGSGNKGVMDMGLPMRFDHLPSDFQDYWIRIDMLDERAWFLIPYGLGSVLPENAEWKQVRKGAPTRPAEARKEDSVQTWVSVNFDLGEVEETGWRVLALISNTEDTAMSLRLSGNSGEWSLENARTSAAYNWPGGYPRLGTCESINPREPFFNSRTDNYRFPRTQQDFRGWGLLRVTVEGHVFERRVPSSLFHYGHRSVTGD